MAPPAGGRLGGFGTTAHAVKRLAEMAMDLMASKRFLDPLQAIDLPRNLVRRGWERAWDLGCRVAKRLGFEFKSLVQRPAVMEKPVQTVLPEIPRWPRVIEPTVEPKAEVKAVPKIAPKIQPKARQKVKPDRDTGWDL